jgi:hypothetical protein
VAFQNAQEDPAAGGVNVELRTLDAIALETFGPWQ